MHPSVPSELTAPFIPVALTAGLLVAFLLLPGGAPGRAADLGASGDRPCGEPAQAEDAALDGGAVRLEGQVHDAQGSPAPDARVLASGRRVHREASSGDDGTFILESLPPGVYTIQAVGSGASSPPARVTIDAGVEPPPILLVLEAAQQVDTFLHTGACAARLAGTHSREWP